MLAPLTTPTDWEPPITCVKCGSRQEPRKRYLATRPIKPGSIFFRERGESLQLTCRDCRYSWEAPCKDRKPIETWQAVSGADVAAWLTQESTDSEAAIVRLLQTIRDKGKRADLEALGEYLEGLREDDSPRSMGWVGDNGQP